MSKTKPTAAERTVSLFTGKTDLEDENARDGTPAAMLASLHRRSRELKWTAMGLTRWVTYRRTSGRNEVEYEVEKIADVYRARGPKLPMRTFSTIGEAGAACAEANR